MSETELLSLHLRACDVSLKANNVASILITRFGSLPETLSSPTSLLTQLNSISHRLAVSLSGFAASRRMAAATIRDRRISFRENGALPRYYLGNLAFEHFEHCASYTLLGGVN